jgi:DNA-binding CsgD family transcriptional regulator
MGSPEIGSLDDFMPRIIEIEARACAKRYKLDADRVLRVFHRLDEVKWWAPDFPRQTALDEAIAYLGPRKALEVFESCDLGTLAQRVWIVSYLNNWFTPFYMLDELASLVSDCVGCLEDNRQSLLKTGFPYRSFGRSFWFDRTLNRLLPVKMPAFDPLADYVLHSGFADPTQWHSPKGLQKGFTEIQQDKNGNLVYDYRWLRTPRRNPRILKKFEDGTFLVSIGLSETRQPSPALCSYDDAAFLPGLDQREAQRLEELRPKLLDVKTAVLKVLREFIQRNTPWRMWEESLCILTATLTGAEATFLLGADVFYTRLDMGTTYSRTRQGSEIVCRNAGLSDLIDVIGHCEKECRFGSLQRTKRAFLDMPQLLYETWVSCYYQALGESWQDRIDKALDKFLLWEEEEKGFYQEYGDRVNSALDQWSSERVAVNISVWIDAKHRHLYEPNIQSYASFQKTQIETTGTLAPLKVTAATQEQKPGQKRGRRRAASSDLSPRERDIYQMVHVQGKTPKQVAIQLGCSAQNVYKHLNNADRKMEAQRSRSINVSKTQKLPEDKRGQVDIGTEDGSILDDQT